MQVKIEAFQIAESFNMKKFRTEFRAEVHSGNNSELFYFFENENRYLTVFDYGVIVFGNYDETHKSEFIRFVKNYAENALETDISETYLLETKDNATRSSVKNNVVFVPKVTPSVCRIVMLNVGQSVAFEFYELLTEGLLESSRKFTTELELKGKLSVSKKELLRFIGKTLNIKNSIVDNLYILDDPNLVWDDEELNYLNRNLKTNFDTFARFKDLDYRLQIVENNLRLFTDVLNHREGTFLEWIVIILISVEILNALIFHR